MVIARFDWQPDRRFYRVFGLSLVLTGLAVAAVLWWRLDGIVAPAIVAGATAVGGLLAVAWPQSWPARLVYWLVALPAFALGTVMSLVLVSVVYYLVVTPLGLALRAAGKDFLGLRGRPASFWHEAPPPAPAERYEHQY